jgi:hypothetical protein
MTRDDARDLLTRGSRRTTEEEITRFIQAYEAGEPIMPVSFYCEAIETWARVAPEVPHPAGPAPSRWMEDENKVRMELGKVIGAVSLAIRKSNLLWRLIYGGERLRTKACPVHKGRWSGCILPGETQCKGACMSGINVTGWLPEPGDEKGTEGALHIVRTKPHD